MIPRTRQQVTAAGAETVYSSGPLLRQKRFPARRRTIRSTAPSTPPTFERQQTLTQIQYIQPVSFSSDLLSDEENDEREERRPKKRRRTRSSDEKKQQQTLTQIDYIWPVPKFEDADAEKGIEPTESLEDVLVTGNAEEPMRALEDASGERRDKRPSPELEWNDDEPTLLGDVDEEEPAPSRDTNQVLSSTAKSALESRWDREMMSYDTRSKMNDPKTPKKVRVLEIPSSQSPAASPLSTQSARSTRHLSRSPLKERSANARVPPQLVLDEPKPVASKGASAKILESQIRPNVREESEDALVIASPRQRKIPSLVAKDTYDDTESEDWDDIETNYDSEPESQAVVDDAALVSDRGISTGYRVPTGSPDYRSSPKEQSAARSFDYDLDFPLLQYESLRDDAPSTFPGGTDLDDPPADAGDHTEPNQINQVEGASQIDSASAQLLHDMREYTQRHTAQDPPSLDAILQTSSDPPLPPTSSPPLSVIPPPDEAPSSSPPPPHPSQATTIDITQQPTLRTHAGKTLPGLNRSSSPLPLPPSSPVVDMRLESQVVQRKFGRVTVSQLLPESLLEYSIPLPPPWLHEEDE